MRPLELALTLGLLFTSGLQAGSPWPKLQGNILNNGNGTGGGSNGSLRWTQTIPISSGSSPAIASDGTIYVATNGSLAALNRVDGSLKWSYPTGSLPGVLSSPAIGSDGTVYATGNGAPLLAAIAAKGTETWQFSGLADGGIYQPTSAPTIASDGTIYVAAEEFQTTTGAGVNQNHLFALNPNGSVKWDFPAGQANVIGSSPAIASDGTLYFGAYTQATTGMVYAVDPTNGHLKWSITTSGQIVCSPAIGPDGTIFVGEQGGTKSLYALNSDGITTRNTFTGTGSIVSTPAVGSDGSLFFPESDGSYYALNPNGTLKWSIPQGTCTSQATVIGSDGVLYYGTRDGHLVSSFQQGTPIWSYNDGKTIASSLAIGQDGALYYGDSGGILNAVGTEVDTVPVVSLTVSPTTVIGGVTSMGTVTIGSQAPKGGALVHLSSSDPTVAVPPFTGVAAGSTQSSFYIGTPRSPDSFSATIIATSGGAFATATLNVQGATLSSMGVSPTTVFYPESTTGIVVLSAPAPANGTAVHLSSSTKGIAFPPTVVVPAGAMSSNFNITTTLVTVPTNCTLTASEGGVTVTSTLTVKPALSLIRLAFYPSSVVGGRTTIGNVAIGTTAPAGGITIQLSTSNSAAATTPGFVTIQSGMNAAAFKVITFAVPSKTTVTITATVDLSSRSANLTVR